MSAAGYLKAVRPQFIVFYVLVVLITGALSDFKNLSVLGLLLLGVILWSASMNSRDEWVDYSLGRDAEAGGMGTIRRGETTIEGLRRLSLVLVALACGIGLYVCYITSWLLLIPLAAAMFLYYYAHVLETLPVLHEWSIGLGIVVLVCGSYLAQTLTLTLPAVLIGAIYSLFFTLCVAIQDFPDIEADRKANKRTFWVWLGQEKASAVLILHVLIATILLIFFLMAV